MNTWTFRIIRDTVAPLRKNSPSRLQLPNSELSVVNFVSVVSTLKEQASLVTHWPPRDLLPGFFGTETLRYIPVYPWSLSVLLACINEPQTLRISIRASLKNKIKWLVHVSQCDAHQFWNSFIPDVISHIFSPCVLSVHNGWSSALLVYTVWTVLVDLHTNLGRNLKQMKKKILLGSGPCTSASLVCFS